MRFLSVAGACSSPGRGAAARDRSQTFTGTTINSGVFGENIAKGANSTSATLISDAITLNAGGVVIFTPDHLDLKLLGCWWHQHDCFRYGKGIIVSGARVAGLRMWASTRIYPGWNDRWD